jgi:hypothetical protein
MLKLVAILPQNRNNLGQISATSLATGLTAWGPKFCNGRADLGTASTQGNPGAIATKPYGHSPTGDFSVRGLRVVTAAEMAKYGAQDALRIDGITGEAMVRKANGTHDLLIHGGRPNLASPTLLRPTNGCLRLLDVDMQSLLNAIAQNGVLFPITLEIITGNPSQMVAGGPDEGYDDPAYA